MDHFNLTQDISTSTKFEMQTIVANKINTKNLPIMDSLLSETHPVIYLLISSANCRGHRDRATRAARTNEQQWWLSMVVWTIFTRCRNASEGELSSASRLSCHIERWSVFRASALRMEGTSGPQSHPSRTYRTRALLSAEELAQEQSVGMWILPPKRDSSCPLSSSSSSWSHLRVHRLSQPVLYESFSRSKDECRECRRVVLDYFLGIHVSWKTIHHRSFRRRDDHHTAAKQYSSQ